MISERLTVDYEGVALTGVLTGDPAQPLALLVHGGPGGTKEGPSDLFVRLVDELARRGIASARLDFRGEGESGGSYADTSPGDQVRQYAAIVAAMQDRGFRRFGVVGESFGATCALSGYDPDVVDALVLLWPAIWLLDGTFAPLVTESNLATATNSGSVEFDGKRVGLEFLQDITRHSDREADLRRVVAPTLLIHGDADTEVPYRQSVRAYDLLPGPKKLVVVPGGDHCLRRPHEQQLAIEATSEWLEKQMVAVARD